MKTKVILTMLLAASLGISIMTTAMAVHFRDGTVSHAKTINVLEHRANNAEIALAFCADKFKRSPKNKRVKVIAHKGGVAIRIGW